MISAILAFFTAIPSIVNGVTAFTTAFFNAKVEITKAKIGGDVAVATKIVTEAAIEQQARISGLKAIASSRQLTWLVILFALPWVIYDFKGVAIDNVWCPWWYGDTCTTPAIKGNLAEWGGMIHAFLFGASTSLALGHMWFGRPNQ
jgi:hypothetical protein